VLVVGTYDTQSAKTDKYGGEEFAVLTAELKKAPVFRDVTQCRLVVMVAGNRYFRLV
jgi:hypothetical protein